MFGVLSLFVYMLMGQLAFCMNKSKSLMMENKVIVTILATQLMMPPEYHYLDVSLNLILGFDRFILSTGIKVPMTKIYVPVSL